MRIALLLILVGLLGCKSLNETKRFANCQFKVNKVTRLEAANINLMKKRKLNDVSLSEGLKLGGSVASNKLPIDLSLSVSVKNPNKQIAALEGFDYRLFIDNREVLMGTYTERTEVPGLSELEVNPSFSFDLLKVLKKSDYKSIMNIVFGLMNENHDPVNLTIMVKPHVNILGKPMKYPDYFKLEEVYR